MSARAAVALGALAFLAACAISPLLVWLGVAIFIAMALAGLIIWAGDRYAADPHPTAPTRLSVEDRRHGGAVKP